MLKGSCNCKGVAFTVEPLPGSSACHCGQCRKQSGHHWASAEGRVQDFSISGEVRWYAASGSAKRGFCPTCGCFLFWKHNDEEKMSFSLGVLDGPTGLRLQKHIFTAFKGDYYDIADGLPQREN
ncbi:GFA family protein [Marimonas sp. MJW-29]|uniref:GFA family protein n=1 Tax=Sulfitobacter sediminis TaxID=3234186 RepID=A0ABV3RLP9_9RHOB